MSGRRHRHAGRRAGSLLQACRGARGHAGGGSPGPGRRAAWALSDVCLDGLRAADPSVDGRRGTGRGRPESRPTAGGGERRRPRARRSALAVRSTSYSGASLGGSGTTAGCCEAGGESPGRQAIVTACDGDVASDPPACRGERTGSERRRPTRPSRSSRRQRATIGRVAEARRPRASRPFCVLYGRREKTNVNWVERACLLHND